MCGIVGYLGSNEAAPILLEALRRLEYRGYDSAGIATIHKGQLLYRRAAGKLSSLSDLLVRRPIRGLSGIAHTRWATHGDTSERNAHPHVTRDVAVVHNGIIENHKELRSWLTAGGHEFRSETDTETIAVLCQEQLDRGYDPVEATDRTIDRLHGQYAVCFLFSGQDDLIVATRSGSPLAIGHSEEFMFLASDAIGMAGQVSRITFLDEGDSAVVTRQGARIRDSRRRPVQRSTSNLSVSSELVSKGGYKHHLLKEIHEQPRALTRAIESVACYEEDPRSETVLPEFGSTGHISILGCGSASYAGAISSYWFEAMSGIHTRAEIASEFRYRRTRLCDTDQHIFISQSGETADTLAALRYVGKRGGRTTAILNNLASTMARECSLPIAIHAGPEISVASTKALTCQLIILASLAIRAGEHTGHLPPQERQRLVKELSRVPGIVNTVLDLEQDIRDAAEGLAEHANALFIGRGLMYPTAMEGALKLKEISYIHSEGLASGELKHGPIALIDRRFPTVVLAPSGKLFAKTISNMEEIRARHGPIVLLTDRQGTRAAGDQAWKTITLPSMDPEFAPIPYTVALQLLAYHAAVVKGTDVDMPRNLAKSVTVE